MPQNPITAFFVQRSCGSVIIRYKHYAFLTAGVNCLLFHQLQGSRAVSAAAFGFPNGKVTQKALLFACGIFGYGTGDGHTVIGGGSAPDFVIASADIAAQAELAGYLDSVGIPCALFRVDSFYDYAEVMDVLCAITERDDLYEKNVTKIAQGTRLICSAVHPQIKAICL